MSVGEDGGRGGLTEDSHCLPSAFKILSERLNVKKESRAKPQHTHRSLSKAVAKKGATSQMWLRVPLCSSSRSNNPSHTAGEKINYSAALTTFTEHYFTPVQASSDNVTTSRIATRLSLKCALFIFFNLNCNNLVIKQAFSIVLDVKWIKSNRETGPKEENQREEATLNVQKSKVTRLVRKRCALWGFFVSLKDIKYTRRHSHSNTTKLRAGLTRSVSSHVITYFLSPCKLQPRIRKHVIFLSFTTVTMSDLHRP